MTTNATDRRHLPPEPGDPELAPFWEGCRAGELRIPRCGKCGRLVWYPQASCRECGGTDISWQRVRGTGRIFTWVTVRRAFLPGYENRIPFVTALVELDDDPSVRLAAWLDCPAGTTLRVGLPVEAFFESIDDSVTLPRFRPVLER